MTEHAPARILVLDNHDSFTFNIVEALRSAGAAVGVVRAERLSPAQLTRSRIEGLVVGPGPGAPEQAGNSVTCMLELDGRFPILGICLGLQCLAVAYGATVGRASQILHGQTSRITHDGRGLYRGAPNPLETIRYNSLLVDEPSVGVDLEVTARDERGMVMGLRRPHGLTEAVQFHPESALSERGAILFQNFLDQVGARRSHAAAEAT